MNQIQSVEMEQGVGFGPAKPKSDAHRLRDIQQ
jgi:hypothetical protein